MNDLKFQKVRQSRVDNIENQNFIKPEMVSNIPDVIPPPAKGPLEAIDEVKKISSK